MKIKGVIFDFDGTLMDSIPICLKAFRHTFYKYLGQELSEEEILATFGPTEEGIFRKMIPDRWKEALNYYLQQYDKAHLDYIKPFSGISLGLEELKEEGVQLAIVSGKGPESMKISLKYTGLDKYFSPIMTGPSRGTNKPEAIRQVLEKWQAWPRSIIYVGDSPSDIIAARKAGVIPVAAAWSDTSKPCQFTGLKPAGIFAHPEDFFAWLKYKCRIIVERE
ncbi:MAG: HAD-IA family hydrolase [Halanaerobium sp.]|nr:HAD-IA family hydrolase [Halanaerobium sp.]